jgi:hypothetical protein
MHGGSRVLTRLLASACAGLAVVLGAAGCAGGPSVARVGAVPRGPFHGSLPLSFERNRGQDARGVEFAARGPATSVYLMRRGALVAIDGARLRMRLAGARPAIVAERRSRRTVNYLRGDDPRRWITNVPTYGQVRYRHAWRGVDVTFHGGAAGELEYDLELAPGANPGRIRVGMSGVRNARVDSGGGLLLTAGSRVVRMRRPVAYQPGPGGRTPVRSRYVVHGDRTVGFAVGAHDPSRPLVIDPVLAYSSYLGGNDIDKALAVAVDSAGNAYVTGQSSSTDFLRQGAIQASNGGGTDAFVTKLSPSGAVVYSTYLGGGAFDVGRGIAVDTLGRVYVTGTTQSGNFPTANAGQASRSGSQDAFVSRLNAAGTALIYSTYHGGTGLDDGFGIAADASGNAYVGGQTDSSNFPTANPIQAARSGTDDGFVSKLTPAGVLSYSTYHGGGGTDAVRGIALDGVGDAYVTGFTDSTNFPRVNPVQVDPGGGGDAFVSKLNTSGTALVFSTYLGGADTDRGDGIAVDGAGSAYVTGFTRSAGFPTTGQAAHGGIADAFVTKLASAGTTIAYSTIAGGGGADEGHAIAVGADGRAQVAGSTLSSDFPTLTAFDESYGGTVEDAFAIKLESSGSVRYATYFGGAGYDIARGIGVDGSGNAWVVGETGSSDFPVVAPLQAQRSADPDGFVAKIDSSDESPPETTIDSGPPARTADRAASFMFSTSEPGPAASFSCRLDSQAFAPCTSPTAFAGLAEGDHTFQVEAVDGYHNVDGTPASSTWTIDLTPPTARLAVSPNPLIAGQVASLDASASSDPGGQIRGYAFDLDGDGAFETDAGDQASTTRLYPAAGHVPVAVRVTDAVGLTSTASVDLQVNPAPVPTPDTRIVRSRLRLKAKRTRDRRAIVLTRLVVARVPSHGRVAVRCRSRRHHCPFAKKTFRGRTVRLTSRFKRRRFVRGDRITLRVTARGVIGKRYLIRFGSRRVKRQTRCLDATTGAVRRCPA